MTLIQFVIGIYLMLVLMRFLFQLVRADFHNPLSQVIVTATNPPLRFLRKFVPGFAGIDWPSIILLFSIQALEISLISLYATGGMPSPIALLVLCLAHLLQLIAYVYMFFIFIIVVISWINPGTYNPLTVLLYQVTDPIMREVRRRVPATGGLDWSPMIVLLGIYLFLALVVAPIMDLGNSLNR
jgi:YggT family protein